MFIVCKTHLCKSAKNKSTEEADMFFAIFLIIQ